MIVLRGNPARSKATDVQIAKHLASLGCTEQQIQRHLKHGIVERVETKVKTQAAWPTTVRWVKPWEVRFN
jgi:hypothetical protein